MTSQRAATSGLARVSVGVVPIVWNNVDLADAALVPAETVLDEIARLGYAGSQFGRGFPRGAALRSALEQRGLRLAEVYLALPLTATDAEARALADDALRLLVAGGGDVLVVALKPAGRRRDGWSGRASSPNAPRLDADAWSRLGSALDEIGRATLAAGKALAFHPHTGTYVETPDEVRELLRATSSELVGVCLDTGHYTVGGGDPVAVIREIAARLRHVHLKDVDPAVLARLRRGDVQGFEDAVRARIFTELGAGMLDLDRFLAELAAIDYGGWLMVEQDTTWLPPSEAAAIGRRVLAFAMRRLDVGVAA